MAGRRRVSTPTMYCRGCDYVLDGLTERQCPECGTPFDPDQRETWAVTPKKPRRRWRGIFAGMGLGLITVAALMILDPSSTVVLSVFLGFIVLAAWMAIEGQYLVRRARHLYELREVGDCDALIHYHESARTWGPLSWLVRNVLIAGAAEVDYAIDLDSCGDRETALAMVDRALERARKRQVIEAARVVRVLVLTNLGRYDEAWDEYETLMTLPDLLPGSRGMGTTPALCTGRFDEVLRIAGETLDEDDQEDVARRTAALALGYQGRFAEALETIDYATSDAIKHLTEKQLIQLRRTKDGERLVESMRDRFDEITRPARLIVAAQIHTWAGDAVAAAEMLDQVQVMPRSAQQIERSYRSAQALCAAMRGDEAAMQRHLSLMWARINDERRPFEQFEAALTAGRCLLEIGRPEEAREHIDAAATFAPHPLSRHECAYWSARCAEAEGRDEAARAGWEQVVADGFDTFMHREADTRLR